MRKAQIPEHIEITKLFSNGRSQAVRIPKKYRFDSEYVSIQYQRGKLIISAYNPDVSLEKFLAMPKFPDFEVNRAAGQKKQKRELF